MLERQKVDYLRCILMLDGDSIASYSGIAKFDFLAKDCERSFGVSEWESILGPLLYRVLGDTC